MMMEDDEGEEIPEVATEGVQLLLEHGADINATAKDGTTVLHHAVAVGNEKVVEYLIEQGADLGIKDSSNRTALDVANGIPKVSNDDEPPELPVYEEIASLLSEAMDAQGIAIEEYMAPEPEETDEA